MVGASSKELESTCELIRFEHMYSKVVPEIGAETDIETSEQNVNSHIQTSLKVCSGEISDEMCNSVIDSDDIAALTVLDVVDLAAEFEQISQMSVLSCFNQDLPVETVKDETQSCETVPTYSKCDSPFMQLNDETAVCTDNEPCAVWSPSSGYNSASSPSAKSPFGDDVNDSFFKVTDADDCDYSWQDSFMLFPSLASYN
jgi:hypothetical protein